MAAWSLPGAKPARRPTTTRGPTRMGNPATSRQIRPIRRATAGTSHRGRPSVADRRSLPVPDGLDGERADVGLSRLLGLSRTKAADLLADGAAHLDGRPLAKSDRLHSGGWLEVDLPQPEQQPTGPPEPVPGMIIRHEDDHIVVVDKPVGVAAHPSPRSEERRVGKEVMAPKVHCLAQAI